MSAVQLSVTAGAAGADSFHLTLTRADGSKTSGSGRLPRERLVRADLEHAIAGSAGSDLARAVREYRDLFAASLTDAAGERLPLDGEEVVLVIVRGDAALHEWPWEILRHDLVEADPVIVVRVLGSGDEVHELSPPPHLHEAELVWIGARPYGAVDIPRYQVLGGVLPLLMNSASALSAGSLRTDATFEDLERMLSADASGRARIVHLDAHGRSQVRPGTEALVDAVFSCALRGEREPRIVEDAELLDRIAASGCALFATNACFGAQQRGPAELPFPAKLVERGVSAAVAAREPLPAWAAATFFGSFYTALASGHSIVEAFERATRGLVAGASGGSWPDLATAGDEALRLLLQPVLWLRRDLDGNRRLGERAPGAMTKSEDVREVAGLAMVPGTVAGMAQLIEDEGLAGRTLDVQIHPSCDLEEGTARNLARALAGLTAHRDHAEPGQHERSSLTLGELHPDERFLLVAHRFGGTVTELACLADVVTGDVAALEVLREDAEGSASAAIVKALSWGVDAPAARPCDALERTLEIAAGMLFKAGLDDLDPPLSSALAALPYALPMTALRDAVVDGVPLPWLGPLGAVAGFDDGTLGGFADADGVTVLRPHVRVQLRARAAVEPSGIALARAASVLELPRPASLEAPRQPTATRMASLSWLSIAVAGRQCGLLDLTALGWIVLVVGAIDHTAAGALVRAVLDGRPTWPDLSSEAREEGERLLAVTLREVETDTRAGNALKLLRSGRNEAVLELLGEDEDHDFDALTTRAYALENQGRTEEARALVLPWLRTLPTMSRWDRCGLLHLLGAIAEREGRWELALRYLLDERALNPPAAYVRVHNRMHLLDILERLHPQHAELAITIAAEAVELTLVADDLEAQEESVRRWLRLLTVGDDRRAIVALARLADEPVSQRSAAVALARAVQLQANGEEASAVAALEPIAAGDGWEAARACLLLGASAGVTPARRVEALRRGVALAVAPESVLCSTRLIDELWTTATTDEIADVAEAVLHVVPFVGQLALAAIAAREGRPEAVDLLVDAISSSSLAAAWHVLPNVKEDALPAELWRDAAEAAAQRAAERLEQLLEEGAPASDAGAALDRILGFYDVVSLEAIPDRGGLANDADYLRHVSERLWDLGQLVNAARARAVQCRLLDHLGDTRSLAIETGWLASIQRQRGHIAQAESLFQRAIELGRGSLSSREHGDLIGRYGNLLHDTGAYEAAVATKWRGLCATCDAVPDDAALTDDALAAVLSWKPSGDANGWTIHVANFANCLIDIGQLASATEVCDAARELLPPDRRHADPDRDRFSPRAEEMVARVQARLAGA